MWPFKKFKRGDRIVISRCPDREFIVLDIAKLRYHPLRAPAGGWHVLIRMGDVFEHVHFDWCAMSWKAKDPHA